MTLIATLIALLGERLLGQFPRGGSPSLLRPVVTALHRLLPWPWLWRSPLIVPLLAAPPIVLLDWLMDQISDPLVLLAASTVILLLCLGPRDLADDVHALLAARAGGESERAARLARALQRGPEPDETHRSLIGALFIQSHERLFGVLMWFFVLGPVGALAYRLASRLPRLLHEQGDSLAARTADTVHGLMAFLSARFTAVLFGLAGSLDDALAAWKDLWLSGEHSWRNHTWAVLAEVATGSLETDSPGGGPAVPATLDAALREVLNLQRRALVILLAAFVLFTAGGWLD